MDKETLNLIKEVLNKRVNMYEQRGQLDISVAYQVALELLIYAENGEVDKIESLNN